MAKNYKPYRCRACGNIFRSAKEKPQCTNKAENCNSRDVEPLSEEEYNEAKGKEPIAPSPLDPSRRFNDILRDMGLRQGREVITNVFFSGNTDDPLHLDNILKLAQVGHPQRKLIIAAWYGELPDKIKKKIDESKEDEEKEDIEEVNMDINKLKKRLKDRLDVQEYLKVLEYLDKPSQNQQIQHPKISFMPIPDGDGKMKMQKVEGAVDASAMMMMTMFQMMNQQQQQQTNMMVNLFKNTNNKDAEETLSKMKIELEKERSSMKDWMKDLQHAYETSNMKHAFQNEMKELRSYIEQNKGMGFSDEVKKMMETKEILLKFAEVEGLGKKEITNKDGKVNWGKLANNFLGTITNLAQAAKQQTPPLHSMQPMQVPTEIQGMGVTPEQLQQLQEQQNQPELVDFGVTDMPEIPEQPIPEPNVGEPTPQPPIEEPQKKKRGRPPKKKGLEDFGVGKSN